MCHHVHVTLSAEERKEARKLAGVMIPVYASIVLAVIAVVAVSGGSRQGEFVAARVAPVATR
jgi:heme/copper-type cytochrome/quinol oxidase subunit 4